MGIQIRITGSGQDSSVVYALRLIASDIEAGHHIAPLENRGECEWEDSVLFTTITEEEEDDQ